MGEKRLIEITSTINMLDGPFLILTYLMSLSSSDMYLFLKYVRESKYSDLNFYDSVKLFSREYLKEKQEVLNDSFFEKLGYSGEMHESESHSNNLNSDYLSNLDFSISSSETTNICRKK